MNIAALQPIHFAVGDVSIHQNFTFQPEPGRHRLPHVNLTTNLEVGANEAGERLFRCSMSVKAPVVPEGSDNAGTLVPTDDSASAEFPYAIEIGVIGIFAFIADTELDQDAMARMVAFNGLSMLYGFARDTVLFQTASGQHGPFMLPALDISDHASRISELIRDAGQTNEIPTEAPLEPKRTRRRSQRRASPSDGT
jgi:hypothetical protein